MQQVIALSNSHALRNEIIAGAPRFEITKDVIIIKLGFALVIPLLSTIQVAAVIGEHKWLGDDSKHICLEIYPSEMSDDTRICLYPIAPNLVQFKTWHTDKLNCNLGKVGLAQMLSSLSTLDVPELGERNREELRKFLEAAAQIIKT